MKTQFVSALLILCGLAGLLTIPAGAAWSVDPNENNPVCQVTGDQMTVRSISDGLGGAIIAWEDDRGGDKDIYTQRIDAQGETLWYSSGVAVCTAANDQSFAELVSDGEGGAIFVWRDERYSAFCDLYAQRVSRDGQVLWSTGGVPVAREDGYQILPKLASDRAGGAIICWQDERSGIYDIYAQRLDENGVRQWASGGVPVCDAAEEQWYPRLVADGTGGAIICWQDYRAGSSETDIYCQHLDSGGAAQWTVNGIAACSAASYQINPEMAADGSGGAFVVWEDHRSGGLDLYVQRVLGDGSMGMDADGEAVCTASGTQDASRVANDGDGGAIVIWNDDRNGYGSNDIYAQRVLANGTVLWTADGVAVCTASGAQSLPKLKVGAVGEALITWNDTRGADNDIYVQRFDAGGIPKWDTDGKAICTASGMQSWPVLVNSDDGSIIVAWHDYRTGAGADVYAQLIERNGQLGDPGPAVTELIDNPDDQGGLVVLSWTPSYLDAYPRQLVTHYSVWRRVPPARSGEADPERSGWAHVEEIPACYWDEYACDAPTYGIYSGSGSPEETEYKVVAHTADQWVFWESAVASGYSVDNLAPGAPLDLTGTPSGSDVTLSWSASGSHDEDLAFYRVYRGDSPGFNPDQGSFIGMTADEAYVDGNPGAGTWYYVVTGEDVHGNIGQASNEATATTTPSATLAAAFDCQPTSGVVPFTTQMTVTLGNLYSGQIRRFSAHVDVVLASGASYPNWRAGFTNVSPGGSFVTAWSQYIPALGSLIGDNVFSLTARDVTPAPYNQPPYPPSGDTAADACTVTAMEP